MSTGPNPSFEGEQIQNTAKFQHTASRLRNGQVHIIEMDIGHFQLEHAPKKYARYIEKHIFFCTMDVRCKSHVWNILCF